MREMLQNRRGVREACLLGLFIALAALGTRTFGAAQSTESSLPAAYDSRDDGRTPTVKSQGELGTCWAISATSALEAYFLPAQRLVFSADHMSLHNGFVIDQNEGGDYRMIMAYLSGWQGPVLETEDPYGDGKTEEGLTAAVHVGEMRILEGADRATFKEMIRRYGSVQSSLYMSRRTTARTMAYYNEETLGYYDPHEEKPDHDILLLGWDDAYPKERFAITPPGDGAWLCQNTWGRDFGAEGLFYVSYYDANLARSGIVYTKAEAAGEEQRIYQTDVCGWQGKLGYGEPDCYFANVYTAAGAEGAGAEDGGGETPAGNRELLTGVGFYATTAHTDYELYLVRDFTGPDSFLFKKTIGRGEIDGTGFFTAELEEPIELAPGERFAVAVNIHSDGAQKPVAVEIRKDRFTQNVTTEGKEGYISLYGGAWENAEEAFDANLCLKAYTRLETP